MLANCFTTESLCPRPPTSWYIYLLIASNTVCLFGCCYSKCCCYVFQTDRPTVIEYDDHEYLFEGFSLFSHTPLTNVSVHSHQTTRQIRLVTNVLKVIMKQEILNLSANIFMVFLCLELATECPSKLTGSEWGGTFNSAGSSWRCLDRRNKRVKHTDVSADRFKTNESSKNKSPCDKITFLMLFICICGIFNML